MKFTRVILTIFLSKDNLIFFIRYIPTILSIDRFSKEIEFYNFIHNDYQGHNLILSLYYKNPPDDEILVCIVEEIYKLINNLQLNLEIKYNGLFKNYLEGSIKINKKKEEIVNIDPIAFDHLISIWCINLIDQHAESIVSKDFSFLLKEYLSVVSSHQVDNKILKQHLINSYKLTVEQINELNYTVSEIFDGSKEAESKLAESDLKQKDIKLLSSIYEVLDKIFPNFKQGKRIDYILQSLNQRLGIDNGTYLILIFLVMYHR